MENLFRGRDPKALHPTWHTVKQGLELNMHMYVCMYTD
jgi:hypothetical protein